jgi:GDP-D-mannose 3',5'-epimerase
MKKALVLGAGGFIGHNLVNRLKLEGFWVWGIDLILPSFETPKADEFEIADLRDRKNVELVINQSFDEVYQLAADMGGAGYIFTGEHDADVMHNSATINLNVLDQIKKVNCGRVFYSSSACIYPKHNQEDPQNPLCTEESAYPAQPDSEYGWEKLFSERLYLSYARNFGVKSRIARYHNIYGPLGTWQGGREKAPAAICRKVAEASNGDEIEIWGDGNQTRSFLFIDDCLEGTISLMRSDHEGPFNIGSEEMISINDLTRMVIEISGKNLRIKNVEGPVGVQGRNSDNKLVKEKLQWEPSVKLVEGMTRTYQWIERQVLAK